MDTSEKIAHNLSRLSAEERRAIQLAMQKISRMTRQNRRTMTRAIMGIVEASARTAGRRASDRKTEPRRRVTIGARVKREFAERCQAAAEASGRSMYRFLHDALARECEAVEGGNL